MPPTPVDGSAPGYFGLYPALVTNLVDEESLGRIEVRLPFLGYDGDRDVRAWATLCTPYADKDSGLEILPDKDSQVMVMFEAGNLRRPYIVGAVHWNGKRPAAGCAGQEERHPGVALAGGAGSPFDDTESAPSLRSNPAPITMSSSTTAVVTSRSITGAVPRDGGGDVGEDHRQHRGEGDRAHGRRHRPDVDLRGRGPMPTVIAESFVISLATPPAWGTSGDRVRAAVAMVRAERGDSS